MTSVPHVPTVSSNDNEQQIHPSDPVVYSEHVQDTSQPLAPSYPEPSVTSTSTGSMAETAKAYLPQSIVGALQNAGVIGHDTSVTASTLPSQEYGFSGSRGGVGTLPGSWEESGVAKLPEEKEAEEKLGHDLGREGVLGTQLEERPMGLMDVIQKERDTSPIAGMNTAAKFVNFDTIPTPQGTPGEGTALKHSIPDSRPTESKAESTPSNNGPSHLPSKSSEREVDSAVNKPLPPTEGTPTLKEENDMIYHGDEAKGNAPRTEPTRHSPPTSPTSKTEERKNSTDVNDTSGKPSFTQKLKGEVKIIQGKIGKNPEKIEQGQALKKGQNIA